MCDIASSIMTIPERMIQEYGSYTKTSIFKVLHNGDTFCLPHYNFDSSLYFSLYVDYLKNIMDTTCNFAICHIQDKEGIINLLNESYIANEKIDNYLSRNFNTRETTFYIIVQNTKEYNIERSLIRNDSFEGECNICYQKTDLKHYYNCELKDKNNHHGICGNCYISWYTANSNNTCPICRKDRRQ